MGFLLFLIFFSPLIGWPQMDLSLTNKLTTGFDPRNDVISDDYLAGPFLIYDCENKHWACVLEEYFEECSQKREQDMRFNKTHGRCAPIGRFKVKFSCFQEQLRLTSNVDPRRLCLLENWKVKEITLD